MKKLTLVLSLVTNDNDYQREQAKAAEDAARQCGARLRILHADNDAINQSQQLLKCIQTESERPDGIIMEPVGTALPQVARAAAKAGVGWVVLNREVDYLSDLRGSINTPVFQVTPDQVEIGRLAGRQVAALLPKGGCILYLQGPSSSSAAQQRAEGFMQTKPANIQVRMMRGAWTEESGYKAATAWLRLSTSHQVPIEALVSQNDVMAIGARNAIKEQATGDERERWMSMAFLGCDGLPATGQAWVRNGSLTATIYVPPTAGEAVTMMARAIETGIIPPERTVTPSKSYPALEMLRPRVMSAVVGRK
ncbi:MAG TPA: substrate-binding domain-containing protein [Terriglobales bacterium]|nr:substrate-binding domain-containing protein [Terriglobales bacterium]